MRAAANGGIALLFQSPRLVAAVAELGSLGISLLRNRGLAAKDKLLDLAGGCFRQLGHNNRGQTNDEARMTNDEGMTKRECNVLPLAHARNRTSEVRIRQMR
jgi:hypothetical protein